jgi:O-acetyl-ADP-ribose deacetylase
MMQRAMGNHVIELVLGDITLQEADAIVNAANSKLAGGGGVDGAIHRHGGKLIMEETAEKYPDGCPTGSAVITKGGNLSAKYVIHAVGPVWSGGKRSEDTLLASAYRRCLELCVENGIKTVAFPSLSTGAYRYPVDLAASVALGTVSEFLQDTPGKMTIRFCLFDQRTFEAYAAVLTGYD